MKTQADLIAAQNRQSASFDALTAAVNAKIANPIQTDETVTVDAANALSDKMDAFTASLATGGDSSSTNTPATPIAGQ